MSATLIINALVVNEGVVVEADVRIREGRIVQIGAGLTCYGDEELVDAACRCLLPGLIGGPADAGPEALQAMVAGGITSHPGLSAEDAGGLINHGADSRCADSEDEAITHLPALLEAVADGSEVLEALVERLIHARARRLGLRDRGYLREEAWADLVLVDLAEPGIGPDGRDYRSRVVGTWVNGERVWDGERLGDARPGRVLEFAA